MLDIRELESCLLLTEILTVLTAGDGRAGDGAPQRVGVLTPATHRTAPPHPESYRAHLPNCHGLATGLPDGRRHALAHRDRPAHPSGPSRPTPPHTRASRATAPLPHPAYPPAKRIAFLPCNPFEVVAPSETHRAAFHSPATRARPGHCLPRPTVAPCQACNARDAMEPRIGSAAAIHHHSTPHVTPGTPQSQAATCHLRSTDVDGC